MERIRVALVCVAVLSLSFSLPAAAASSVVQDARGDLRPGLPAYLDIAQAKVTDEVGTDTLVFSQVLSAPVPQAPSEGFLAYNWLTGSKTAPTMREFLDVTSEYAVVLRSCTERVPCFGDSTRHWVAFVNHFDFGISRAPTFKIDGASVKVFVSRSLLGDPTSFYWAAVTRAVPGGTGPEVEAAPDSAPAHFAR